MVLNYRSSGKGATSALLLALSAAIFWPSALLAHARLVQSDPAAGSRVAVLPPTARLVFSEMPELALSRLRLVTAAGDTVAIGNLRRDEHDKFTLVGDLPAKSGDGAFMILWNTAASDGHATHGIIAFKVIAAAVPAATTAGVAPPAGESAREPTGSGTIAIGGALIGIVTRWLAFISVFLIIGVVTFRSYILRKMEPGGGPFSDIASVNAATLGIAASAGALLAAALKITQESVDMPDVPLGSMIFGSRWGLSMLVQLVAPVAAASGFYFAQKRAGNNAGKAWRVALVSALALVLSISFASHAASGDRPWLAVPLDALHMIVGSMWLGTLAVIVIVGISASLKTPDEIRPGARVAGMINYFSPLALICGGSVVASGIGSAIMRLPEIQSLWTTSYGSALFRKLIFVALLLATGAWNWKRMKPRLVREHAIAPLRRSAILELAIAAVVLALTAILVALELP